MANEKVFNESVPEAELKIFYNPRREINRLIKEGDYRRLLIKAAELHGHFCVGLALGVKASLIALKKLGVELPDRDVSEHVRQELIAVVDNNLCFVDGVQMIVGSTLGNNSLVFRDMGRLSLTLIDRRSGRAVRVSLLRRISTPTTEHPRFNELFQKAMIRREELSPEEAEEFRSLMDRASLEVIAASEEDNFKVEEFIVEDMSEFEKRDPPGKWVNCSHCGSVVMESKARKKEDRYYCAECAGDEVNAVVGRRIVKVNAGSIVKLSRVRRV